MRSEQYELGKVCSRLSSGKGISAKEICNNGVFPVYGGNGLRGYANKANFEGECAIIGRQGAFCGNVRYFKGTAYMTEHAVVVCANERNNTQYLAYLLSTMSLGNLSGQSAQPGLSVKTLAKQIVSLPSFNEQHSIAATLSCLDNKIELNNKINHNLEQQAQAIFKSWFVDFKPFQDSEFVDSELGPIPKGWRVGRFTDIANVLGGGTPKTDNSEYWGRAIPFFTPKDVAGTYTLVTEKCLSNIGLENCNSSLYPPNTVFITARGTVGKIALAGVDMAMNQSCYALCAKAGYGQLYVFGMAQKVVDSLRHKSSGAVFNAIVIRDFSSEFVVMPDGNIVERYESLVAPTFDQVLANTKQSRALATLRDTLLPKLMSGEIDVSDISAP